MTDIPDAPWVRHPDTWAKLRPSAFYRWEDDYDDDNYDDEEGNDDHDNENA